MALSETIRPGIAPAARRATSARIPITARELVEWTYAVQRAQGVPELTLEPQGRSQTGIVVDRMIEFAQLGCKVDVSSNAAVIWGEARCDEDAIAVHEIVRGMAVNMRALLITHGRQRSAPEWNPLIMPLRCLPVPGRKGAHKGIYARQRNNMPVGTVVTYVGDWPDRRADELAKFPADAFRNPIDVYNKPCSGWRDLQEGGGRRETLPQNNMGRDELIAILPNAEPVIEVVGRLAGGAAAEHRLACARSNVLLLGLGGVAVPGISKERATAMPISRQVMPIAMAAAIRALCCAWIAEAAITADRCRSAAAAANRSSRSASIAPRVWVAT